MIYKITETVAPLTADINLGDTVVLKNQSQEVVACIKSGVKMLNIDASQLAPGDLTFIKKLGLTISNPETAMPVALGVEYQTFGHKLANWFENTSDESDDDSSFFTTGAAIGESIFGGSEGGGGFGGFGGGSFSGGGASASF